MHYNYQIKPPLLQARTLEAVSIWVEALHCHGSLLSAVRTLSELVGAQAGLLVRLSGDDGKLKKIAYHDSGSEKLLTKKCRPFALEYLSDCLGVLSPGSIVSLQGAVRDGGIDRDTLAGFHADAGLYNVYDIAVIPLQTGSGAWDFIEFQYSAEMAQHDIDLLATLAGSLARTWKSRVAGTSEKEIAKLRSRHGRRSEVGNVTQILGPSNPLELTRCEFRVCTLVKEGMLAGPIAKQLRIRNSTVRSHLRSIYSKTGTACHVELLHSLTTGDIFAA